MVYVFAAAVAAGGTYAAVSGVSRSAPPSTVATPASGAPNAPGRPPANGVNHATDPAAGAPGAAQGDPSPEGDVLEVIDVPQYTYARLGAPGSQGTWIAVPTSKLAVGSHVKLRGAVMMANFESSTLKRSFPEIWFGTLADGSASAGAAGADPGAGSADTRQNGGPGAKAAPSTIEVKKVEKAAGANGYTVAELWGQRAQLVGKTVRVRATVVKMNPNILGKTYLHVRDGSGDASTNDLTVTTLATPAVGDVVLLEGVLNADRDIGSGYKFPTIVEDAKLVTP